MILLTSCSEQKQELTPTEDLHSSATKFSFDLSHAESVFWSTTRDHLTNSYDHCLQFAEQTSLFLDEPQAKGLATLQGGWQRLEQKLNHLYSFSRLIESSPEIFKILNTLIYRGFAQPIQPGYLDRFGAYRYSGIVFDIGFPLNKNSLTQQNGLTDNEEVLLGFYAIEFMLFGENGNRSSQDYSKATQLSELHIEQKLAGIAEVPNNRRRKLLSLQTAILCEDLHKMALQLSNGADRELANWHALSAKMKISKARSTLEFARTEILFSLVELQKKLGVQSTIEQSTIEQSTIEESAIELTDESSSLLSNHNPSTGAQHSKLASRIRSLIDITIYLSDIEREGASTQLNDAANLLEQIPPSADPASLEHISEQLQDIYTKVRTAY